MPRVKRGTQHTKRRRNLLSKVKGYKWSRKSKLRQARPAMLKAGAYAYRDRRRKKRDMRRLWTTKINAASRMHGMSYSVFINKLKQTGSEIDRKVLAVIAEKHPETFGKIIAKLK